MCHALESWPSWIEEFPMIYFGLWHLSMYTSMLKVRISFNDCFLLKFWLHLTNYTKYIVWWIFQILNSSISIMFIAQYCKIFVCVCVHASISLVDISSYWSLMKQLNNVCILFITLYLWIGLSLNSIYCILYNAFLRY